MPYRLLSPSRWCLGCQGNSWKRHGVKSSILDFCSSVAVPVGLGQHWHKADARITCTVRLPSEKILSSTSLPPSSSCTCVYVVVLVPNNGLEITLDQGYNRTVHLLQLHCSWDVCRVSTSTCWRPWLHKTSFKPAESNGGFLRGSFVSRQGPGRCFHGSQPGSRRWRWRRAWKFPRKYAGMLTLHFPIFTCSFKGSNS